MFLEGHGDKECSKSIALFGAPGTSKSVTLSIAARLFTFWEHRVRALKAEKTQLQTLITVGVRFQLFEPIYSNDNHFYQELPSSLDLRTKEGMSIKQQIATAAARLQAVEHQLGEYEKAFNSHFSGSDTKLSVIAAKKVLALCITFNKGMEVGTLSSAKLDSISRAKLQLNTRFVFSFVSAFCSYTCLH